MPQPHTLSKKSLVLTDEAFRRLIAALAKEYGGKCPKYTYLSDVTGVDRGTISKILKRTGGATFSKIQMLFDLVHLDLDEQVDCQEWQGPPKTKTQQSRQLPAALEQDVTVQLKTALWTLNYRKQVGPFEDFVGLCEPARAFLVQGKTGSCQRWLVNRLVYQFLPEISSENKISISPRNDETYIEELWEQLGHRLLQDRAATPAELVEHVYRRWREETVILVFHDLDRLPPSQPQKIIQEFWRPLVRRLQAESGSENGSYLLMFLVDNVGDADEWNLAGALDEGDVDMGLEILPVIDQFKRGDLQPWVNKHRDLPKLLPDLKQLRKITERLLKEGRDGEPDRTMQAICARCGGRWFDIENSLDL